MDCPKCGTWNPDDKMVCWRCQTPLPKPEPKKEKRRGRTFLGIPFWIYILIVLFVLVPWLGQCVAQNVLR